MHRNNIVNSFDNIENRNKQIESLYNDKNIDESLYREDFLTEVKFERNVFMDLTQIKRVKKEGEDIDTE